MARLTFSRRRVWNNHTGNEGIDPLRIFTPGSLEEIVEIVKEAESAGVTVRAVGSRHSWSDVALTSGYVLEPEGVNRPLELERELLRVDPREPPLVRVQAGMRIRELNAYLDERGLGLPNMGGYDGQTVAGVMATSTHGSGLSFGPLTDLARSIDVVGSGGVVYRVEPAEGPTDPAAFAERHPERRLMQDERWFDAVRVGMGCLGVIYAVMLEVVGKHYLREVRTLSTWSEVKEQLRAGEVLRENLHYEVYFNPYKRDDGQHSCLVTTRNRVSPEEYKLDRRRTRNWLAEALSAFPLTPAIINLLTGLWPSLAPGMIDRALGALADGDYTNVSYKVLNIGAANYLPAYSCEIGLPIDERELHLEAVERIFAVAERHARLGDVYQSSPISLRFVKASSACMSMMEGRETMMMELIAMTHTQGGFELLGDYEEKLYELGGRPHWGQVNTLTGSNGLVAEMYPRYEEWLEVHGELNRSGVFDGPFSKRVGISRSRYRP
jgi:hypothetical protein